MHSPAPEARRRHNALRALLAFTLPGASLFALLNLQFGAHLLALLDALLVLVSLVFLLAMRHRTAALTLSLMYLLVLFSSIAATLARPDLHPGADMWMAVIPILSYLLLGVRLGSWVGGVALLAAISAYLTSAEAAPHRLELLRLAHVLPPVVGLFLVCHCYARVQTLSEADMLRRIYRDPLTRLWNREKLLGELERERQRAKRTGMPLSMLLIDLDHFKRLNDRYGHDAGDSALVFFADLLRQRLRATDLPCRIGGEEFAVLLPDTAVTGAVTVAENLRQALERSDFSYRGETIGITLSAGVVEVGRDGEDWPHLYRAADARLYAAKERGRNCVLSTLQDQS